MTAGPLPYWEQPHFPVQCLHVQPWIFTNLGHFFVSTTRPPAVTCYI